ncbi:MAG TPA: hypothetical protein VF268_03585 [Gammaproteobacteria bacterium]
MLILSIFGFMAPAGAQSDLLGKWTFHSANHVIPQKCAESYLEFVSPSRIMGSDGSRSATIAYSAEKIEPGYNLITEKISDDGRPDCRGNLSGKPDVNEEKLGFFFISLSEDKQYMKFYFSADLYYIYQRVK